jgi:hypothetical protein
MSWWRTLQESQRLPLERAFAALEQLVTFAHQGGAVGRRYAHLYKEGVYSDALEPALLRELLDVARSLLTEGIVSGRIPPSDEILMCGFLISEPGAPAQEWHIDYEEHDIGTIFVPLTVETADNSTQYERSLGNSGHSEIYQVLGPPFAVVQKPKRGRHRGVENREPWRRVVWYFEHAELAKLPAIAEPLFLQGSRLAMFPDSDHRMDALPSRGGAKSV